MPDLDLRHLKLNTWVTVLNFIGLVGGLIGIFAVLARERTQFVDTQASQGQDLAELKQFGTVPMRVKAAQLEREIVELKERIVRWEKAYDALQNLQMTVGELRGRLDGINGSVEGVKNALEEHNNRTDRMLKGLGLSRPMGGGSQP